MYSVNVLATINICHSLFKYFGVKIFKLNKQVSKISAPVCIFIFKKKVRMCSKKIPHNAWFFLHLHMNVTGTMHIYQQSVI